MVTAEWPQPPNLPGRTLDTALLLNRDHVVELRGRIQNKHDDETSIPTEVVLSFLNNLDVICEGLCRQGPLRQNSLESCAKVQETAHRIPSCTCTTRAAVNVPRDLKKHRKYHASRNATLHILDPQHWNLKEAEVDSLFKRDSDGLSLKDRPVQITLLPPAKIMLKADNVEGARMLRKIKPRNFCCGAYSRRYWSLDRELPN
ncbi:MAG: hypothetical protein Q9200_001590 [Gallowayella weberi]